MTDMLKKKMRELNKHKRCLDNANQTLMVARERIKTLEVEKDELFAAPSPHIID